MKKVTLATVLDQTKNQLITYYSDNTITVQPLCKKTGKALPPQPPPPPPPQSTTTTPPPPPLVPASPIDQLTVKGDTLLNPLHVACVLQNCTTIFTDIFNNIYKKEQLQRSQLISRAIFVCPDSYDFMLFANIFKLHTVADDATIIPNKTYIYINPKVAANKISIYTVAPPQNVAIFCKFFKYTIHEIFVQEPTKDDVLIQMSQTFVMQTNVPYKLNINIAPQTTFKIILSQLALHSITINKSLYNYIEEFLHKYRQFRIIKISGIVCQQHNNLQSSIVLDNNYLLYK